MNFKRKKQILFFCASTPTVMFYKIGRLLKKHDYETVLFTLCEKNMFDYGFYNQAFDKIICPDFALPPGKIQKLKYLPKRLPFLISSLISLKKLNPYLVIGTMGGNWKLRLAHKYFFKKFPFIYYPYDILSHFHDSKDQAINYGVKGSELYAEKYCFEKSDGIMHKGAPDELEILQGRIFPYVNFTKNQINFMPYCSKEFSVPINPKKLSKKDNEIHIVYPGFLANDSDSVKKFMYYFDKILNQKMHLHIYTFVTHVPKNEEEKYLKNYFNKIKDNPYFHLHNPLGPKEIVSEISKYDYGLWLSYETNESNIEHDFAVGNKVSTFLEAGLSMICHDNTVYLNRLMDSYGLKIRFNDQDIKTLKTRLKKLDSNKIRKNLEKARKEFDLEANFLRLEKFFERVVGSKNNNTYKF